MMRPQQIANELFRPEAKYTKLEEQMITTDLILPEGPSLEEEWVQAAPTVSEGLWSAFTLENTAVNAYRWAEERDFWYTKDDNFDVTTWNGAAGVPLDLFGHVRNQSQAEVIAQNYWDEREALEIRAQMSGVAAFAFGAIAAVVDPVNLLAPTAARAIIKTATSSAVLAGVSADNALRIATGAIKARRFAERNPLIPQLAYGAGTTAAQETILQAAQSDRTLAESAFNIASDVFLLTGWHGLRTNVNKSATFQDFKTDVRRRASGLVSRAEQDSFDEMRRETDTLRNEIDAL